MLLLLPLLLAPAKHAAGGAVGSLPIVSAASLNVPVPGAHSVFFVRLVFVFLGGIYYYAWCGGGECTHGGERMHTNTQTHAQSTHRRCRRRRRRAQSWCRTRRRSWRSRTSSSRGSCSSVSWSSGLCDFELWWGCWCWPLWASLAAATESHMCAQTSSSPSSHRLKDALPCAHVDTTNNAAIRAARQGVLRRAIAAIAMGMRMCTRAFSRAAPPCVQQCFLAR